MKTVGILGSGVVAKVLGNGFMKHGYDVMLGTGDAGKLAEWQKKTGGRVGSFAEAAAHGGVIVLAVKGTAAQDVLQKASADHLKGKTIIDTTNPIADVPPQNGVLRFFTSPDESLMERLQNAHPGAKFVKAFNSVGNALMINPDFKGVKPTMFICGNDGQAKKEVEGILTSFGWESEDLGTAEAARAIESLCILWCIPGFLRNQWSHAFKMLKP